MKKVLALIKSNLVSTICVIIAVLALPALLFVSLGQNAKIQEEVQGDITGKTRTLQQVDYNYVFEPVTPQDQRIEFSRTPSESTNEAMQSWGEQLRSQADEAVQLLVQRNADGKRVLLDGLFPAPSEPQKVAKLQEIVSLWPVAHRSLLSRAKAGLAPDVQTVLAMLNTQWRLRIEQLESTLADNATEADYDQIRADLSKDRMSMYRATAAELRFYVEPNVFEDVQPWESNALPPMETVWDWQWRHWIHADIIDALRLANTDGTWERSLLDGPVKHLELVEVTPWSFGGQTPPAPISFNNEIQYDWNASLTGRAGWPSATQGLYDVRNATITVIIDSTRLNTVIAAINATNLMRVINCTISDFDPSDRLPNGYVYGNGHLVRSTFTIETVWLRSWMKEYMPAEVRQAMGIPEDVTPEGEGSDGAEAETPQRSGTRRR